MWFLKVLLVLIVAVPLAFVGTFILAPLWSWIEARFAIEAMGHSAPAGWCFIATYALLALLGLVIFAVPTRRPL
jgi:hypothetical protein